MSSQTLHSPNLTNVIWSLLVSNFSRQSGLRSTLLPFTWRLTRVRLIATRSRLNSVSIGISKLSLVTKTGLAGPCLRLLKIFYRYDPISLALSRSKSLLLCSTLVDIYLYSSYVISDASQVLCLFRNVIVQRQGRVQDVANLRPYILPRIYLQGILATSIALGREKIP